MIEIKSLILKLSLWQNLAVALTFVRAVFNDHKVSRRCAPILPTPLAEGVAHS